MLWRHWSSIISPKSLLSLYPIIKSLMVWNIFKLIPILTTLSDASVEKVIRQTIRLYTFHERKTGKHLFILAIAQGCNHNYLGKLHILTEFAKQQDITIQPLFHFIQTSGKIQNLHGFGTNIHLISYGLKKVHK